MYEVNHIKLLLAWLTPVPKKLNTASWREPIQLLMTKKEKNCVKAPHVRDVLIFVLKDINAWTWTTEEMLSTLVLTSMTILSWPTMTVSEETARRSTRWNAPELAMPKSLISTGQTLLYFRLFRKLKKNFVNVTFLERKSFNGTMRKNFSQIWSGLWGVAKLASRVKSMQKNILIK